jgi:hypothetical protein
LLPVHAGKHDHRLLRDESECWVRYRGVDDGPIAIRHGTFASPLLDHALAFVVWCRDPHVHLIEETPPTAATTAAGS